MKIITALGNEKINEKIKNKKNLEIIYNDIQYQEALLEILEKSKNIDLLILSSILPGELNIYELINIIKYKNPNINIFIILEKRNEELINFLIKKGINNIFFNNKTTFEELIKKIEEKNNNLNNNEIIKENKIKILIKIINNKIKNNKKIKNKKILNKNNKIISIIGPPKIGKTIVTILLSLNLKNKKILIIDFNFLKKDLKTILGKKEVNDKNLIKYNKNIDLIIHLKDKVEFKEKIDNYDYIFFDIGNYEDSKEILKDSYKIIILVEPNLLGIKESKEILEKIIYRWKNQKNKIKIIYNKTNKYSINEYILKQMFSDFEILGKLKNDYFYNFLINNNLNIKNIKINNEYKKILKKLFSENK